MAAKKKAAPKAAARTRSTAQAKSSGAGTTRARASAKPKAKVAARPQASAKPKAATRPKASASSGAKAAPERVVPRPGAPAPDFALLDQNGDTVRLSALRGKKVLLYFYPKADTPGCTKQSCSVRDHRSGLSKLGVTALGISPDKPAAQAKFDQKYGLGFPLLSDPDRATARAYGAFGEKTFMGRKVIGIIRSSYLVDENGRIAAAWSPVSPDDTVPNAQAALRG